jgi:hypothetical protein
MSDAAVVPLHGDWWTWSDLAVRSAGFPVHDLVAFGAPALACAADATDVTDDDFAAHYVEETRRSLATLARTVGTDLFREAMLWQNRRLVPLILDTFLETPDWAARRKRRRRRIENTLVNYVQRYHAKNESIGFFGPVGWARWHDDGPPVTVSGEQGRIARRTVQFEHWAVQALAEEFSADPAYRRWQVPRVSPQISVIDGQVHGPVRQPVRLPPLQMCVLDLCDGHRTIAQVTARAFARRVPGVDGPGDVEAAIAALERRGYLTTRLAIPPSVRAEEALRLGLDRIDHAGARAAASEGLHRMEDAYAKAVMAGGAPVELESVLSTMESEFHALTGRAASHHADETLVGRALLVEDCRSAARLRLGPQLRDDLAAPLNLLLTSGRWLVDRIARRYLDIIEHLFDQLLRPGATDVPLAAFCWEYWPRCGPDEVAAEAAPFVAELQHRWRPLLAIPPDAHRHRVDGAAIADAVHESFAAPSATWLSGRYHSPDIMIAARGLDEIERGEYEPVLGELHLAQNTLDKVLFVDQHPEPDRLRRAAQEDAGRGRWLVPVYPSTWPWVTGRAYPPPFQVTKSHRYLWFSPEEPRDLGGQPADPIGAFTLRRGADGDLVIRHRDGAVYHPLAVLGEFLSATSLADTFALLPDAPHQPRVSIDRLVVSREKWRMPLRDLSWLDMRDEARRYRAVRAWAGSLGLPRFVFLRTQPGTKPYYLDLTSPLVVNLAVKKLRQAVTARPDGCFTVTEMHPDPLHTWLPYRDGQVCTSELRLAIVDRAVRAR